TLPPILGASSWVNWSLGDFTLIDLIAATTFAFNAALIVRRPDHWKHYAIVGIILFAIIGRLAGGISRDLLLGERPAALSNPLYLVLPIAAALLAIRIEYHVLAAIPRG